jgi:hypothetical protein
VCACVRVLASKRMDVQGTCAHLWR